MGIGASIGHRDIYQAGMQRSGYIERKVLCCVLPSSKNVDVSPAILLVDA